MAAERVFSLLQNSFSHVQQSSLEDYISVSVMLQYNRKQDILYVYKTSKWHDWKALGNRIIGKNISILCKGLLEYRWKATSLVSTGGIQLWPGQHGCIKGKWFAPWYTVILYSKEDK